MKNYNFHTLRDTFAVRCLKAGMSVENLSYVLGHANVAVTAARYKAFYGSKTGTYNRSSKDYGTDII